MNISCKKRILVMFAYLGPVACGTARREPRALQR
jgi:hypothetical protein